MLGKQQGRACQRGEALLDRYRVRDDEMRDDEEPSNG